MLTLLELSRLSNMWLMVLASELLTLVSPWPPPSIPSLWWPPPSIPSPLLLQCLMVLPLNQSKTLQRLLRPELLTWPPWPRLTSLPRERPSLLSWLEPQEFSAHPLPSSTTLQSTIPSLLSTLLLLLDTWDMDILDFSNLTTIKSGNCLSISSV